MHELGKHSRIKPWQFPQIKCLWILHTPYVLNRQHFDWLWCLWRDYEQLHQKEEALTLRLVGLRYAECPVLVKHTSHVFTEKVCKTERSRLRAWRTKLFDAAALVLMGLTRTKLLSVLTLTARTACTDLLSICVHPQHLVISCSNFISLSGNPSVYQYRTDSKQQHTEPRYLIPHICFCLPRSLALTKPLLHFSDGRAKHCLENPLWLCPN